MASIQQSINQMLYTGTVGAGLYAHSPAGQKQAKIKSLEKNVKTYNKKIEEGLGSNVDYQKRAELASELFNLDPSEQRLATEEEYTGASQKIQEELSKAKQKKEAKALESLTARSSEIENQKRNFKERIQLLDQYGNKIGGTE